MQIDEKLKIIYETIAPSITRTENAWAEYLKFSSRIYKHSFDNALLVYAQNPKATMLAPMSIWNKVGRYVTKGEKGTAVCEYENAKLTLKYLFDVSQTNGNKTPEVWLLNEEKSTILAERLAYSYNLNTADLNGTITQISEQRVFEVFDDYMRDFENDIAGHFLSELPREAVTSVILETIENSVKYFVVCRCGKTDMEMNLPTISHFDTIPLIARLGYTVTEISKGILIEIERNVKIIDHERGVQHEQRNPSEYETERTPEQYADGRIRTAGQIRPDGDKISARTEPPTIFTFEDARATDEKNAPSGQRGEGENRGDNPETIAARPITSDRGHTSENAPLQQAEGHGGGDNPKRDCVREEVALQQTFEDIEIESPVGGSFLLPENDESFDAYCDKTGYTAPFVVVEWSESNYFADNEQLSFTEADLKFKEVEKIERVESIERYGEQLGYNKTGGKIYYLDNEQDAELSTYEFRYDIGDYSETQSGLFNHVTNFWQHVENNISSNEYSGFDKDEMENIKRMLEMLFSYQDTSFIPYAEKLLATAKSNYRYSKEDTLYSGGAKTKYKANIEAIRLLKRLENDKRLATADEQKTLANYVGWGGIANAFSKTAAGWENEYIELKHLLEEDEYKAAMNSTITAYYTEPKLIEYMYKAIGNFGFEGGDERKILDPAMGTGNFFSVLPWHLQGTKLYGVELDSITGRIAKQLYQTADVSVQGFETTRFEDNSFDIAIGNIPFNNIKVFDRRYEDHNFLIHDYFLTKSLDLVKHGGIVAYITSKGTLDKRDSSVREYLAERADLIGAIRLPNNAFKALAGTEVTADILFFQKLNKVRDVDMSQLPKWVHTGRNSDHMLLNQYFIDNPKMILGEMQFSKNMYGNEEGTACIPFENQDLYAKLDKAINNLSATFTAKPDVIKQVVIDDLDLPEETEKIKAEHGTKNSIYVIEDDEIYFTNHGYLEKQNVKGKKAERIKGLCEIKTALQAVIAVQSKEYQNSELEAAQKMLNAVYDSFVKKNGFINDKPNIAAFYDDDQFPLLRSIEDENEDKTAYTKAPIFTRATIKSYRQPTHAESAKEALEISLNVKMKVDLSYMAGLCKKTEVEITAELGDRIYLNPVKYYGNPHEGWETSEEYLSGDVTDKLAYAMLKADNNSLFKRNVEALKTVQPAKLMPSDIDFRIGSPWIPAEYFKQFMFETFGTDKYHQNSVIDLDYLEFTTTWRISGKNTDSSISVNQTYGTKRVNAYEIYEDCLNLQSTTVRDRVDYRDADGKDQVKYVVNAAETMIARSKQQQIKEVFSSWLFSDNNRAENLLTIYNETFNTIRPREYNGSHLVFPNMNEEKELRPHQQDVAARIIYSGTCLMAHEVGAGKTAAMIAAGVYMKNIGAIKKPIYVVPNHLCDQWATEFYRFFPTANLLVTNKKDFEKHNRKKFVSKIAVGDYDAIIIGHSQFERIPISKERQETQLNEEISHLTEVISKMKTEKGENWAIKQVVIFQNNLKNRLTKLIKEERKDDLLTFEQLGVDYMFVDEAHVYKNCFTYTKMRNVAGIGKSSSQRASDMLLKCQYLQEMNQGKGVTFATGTPISNSMSELFVMQRYLQPNLLKKLGLNYFDSWAATFGEVTSSLEITPEGSGYRMKNRFSKFHNLPELMNMFRLVADIQTSEMLNLPIPALEGGKANIIVTQCSEFQQQIMDEFVLRADAIRKREVDPSEDNMLKLTNEAKLMAIDPRLVYEDAPNDYDSKLNTCIRNVYSIWEATAEKQLAQVVFCDSGTPKSVRFNVYDETKTQLIKMGIPANEIAFVHDAKTDAQRDDMFEKVRNGVVRVILGSTGKLGTGTNIQNLLVAEHDLDVPWRPSDITQRSGRILRQGNKNSEISINRYVTKGTFDSYLWQIQEQKLRYITQVMTGKSISRSCEDADETVLSAAEVKAIATANPLLAEKMEVDNEVTRLKLLKGNWSNERLVLVRNIENAYPTTIKVCEENIVKIRADMITEQKTAGREFAIIIDGKSYTERTKAGETLVTVMKAKCEVGESAVPLGEYRGFELRGIRKNLIDAEIRLCGESVYKTEVGGSALGCITRIENLSGRLSNMLNETKQALAKARAEFKEAKIMVVKPFEFEEKLNDYVAKQSEINTKLEIAELSKQEETIFDEKNADEEESEEYELEDECGNDSVYASCSVEA